MKKADLVQDWTRALEANRFLTPKHDPNGQVVYASFRTVLSHDASGSLESMVRKGDFTATEYQNKHGSYYVVEPSAQFSSLGAHIPSGSLSPTGSYDRLVVVSGSLQGWHVFAEQQSSIDTQVAAGQLMLIGPVNG